MRLTSNDNRQTNIRDVARAEGVSVSTVSRVLSGNSRISDETKEKAMKIAKDIGYKPHAITKGLARNCSNSIENMKIYAVDNDNFKAVFELTKHLLDKQYEHITFIGGGNDLSYTMERLEGYKRCIETKKSISIIG